MTDYRYYLDAGICPVCRKENVVQGKCRCQKCLEKQRESSRKYREKRAILEEQNEALKEQRLKHQRIDKKRWRDRHRERKICLYCSRPATHGIACDYHWKQNVLAQSKKPFSRICAKNDILQQPETLSKGKTDVGKLIALHNAGWKGQDIADEMKISRRTVCYWLKKAREEEHT